MKKLLILALMLMMLVCCLSVIASAASVDISKHAIVNASKETIYSNTNKPSLRNLRNGLVAGDNDSQAYFGTGTGTLAGVTGKVWVRFDFGGSVFITSSEITWSTNIGNVAKAYTIAYSADGVTWTTVPVSGNTEIVNTKTYTTAITARYYAYIITEPTQAGETGDIRINEIKIFGELPEDYNMNLTADSTATTSGTPSVNLTDSKNTTPITNLIDGCVATGNAVGCFITGNSYTAPLDTQKYSDGDAATTLEWETGVKDWIEFDLGVPCTVKQYKIYPHGTADTALKTFYVLTSYDGVTWRQADYVADNSSIAAGLTNYLTAPVERTLGTPANARYVAIAVIQQNSAATNIMRIQEIEIRGTLYHHAPENLTWTDKTASWDSVATAASYSLQLINNGATPIGTVIEGITTTSYDFTSAIGTAPGEYTFKVWAVKAGKTTAESPNETSTAKCIVTDDVPDMPKDLKFVGTVASWSPVDTAIMYTVKLICDGKYIAEEVTSGTRFDFAAQMESSKTYSFCVNAATATKESAFTYLSQSITYAPPAPQPTQQPIIFLPLYLKYTITYHANDGVVKNIIVTPGDRLNTNRVIAENTFTNGNKTFVEWNTMQNGKGKSYAPGAKLLMNQNYHLFAIWK